MPKVQEKVLRIQMLGEFAMYYGDEAITLKKIGSSKSVRLLQMLLLSLKTGISKPELLDNLYGWNERMDVANRNKNLNNLIYRLKSQLAACGLPEDAYVEICGGICSFKCSIPVELDTQQFEEALEKANRCSGEERIRLLRRANEMYRGELLPANQSEPWFFQKSNYFKELYLQTIRELEEEFQRKKDYKNRTMLYARAVAIYPFDNWQVRQIRCCLEMYHYDEAMDIYNNTMELYARELGSPPIAELQECFEGLDLSGGCHGKDLKDLNSWKNMDRVFMESKEDIKREIFQKNNMRGAYYCAYPSFVDYCRLIARAKVRSEFEAVLMFLTLSSKEKRNIQKKIDLQEQMELLKTVIGDSLRAGDAYTRYGNRHFILMLVKAEEEYCSDIFRRIEMNYIKVSGKADLWYCADMTQRLDEAII